MSVQSVSSQCLSTCLFWYILHIWQHLSVSLFLGVFLKQRGKLANYFSKCTTEEGQKYGSDWVGKGPSVSLRPRAENTRVIWIFLTAIFSKPVSKCCLACSFHLLWFAD